MITLGITGGMGSGKSYVCGVFETQGIPVYDTDQKTKDLLNDNLNLKNEIISNFGSDCYKDKKWNRDYIVEAAAKDNTILSKMGTIIEPYLVEDFKKFKNIFSVNSTGYESSIIAIESAILFKSKLLMDEITVVLVVTAPLEVRIDRIKKRDPFRSEREIKMLIDKQPAPLFCDVDFWIENNGKDVTESIVEIIDRLESKINLQL